MVGIEDILTVRQVADAGKPVPLGKNWWKVEPLASTLRLAPAGSSTWNGVRGQKVVSWRPNGPSGRALEEVATPQDIDAMWNIFTSAGIPPFRLMDRVGLDVVLAIEEHYATVGPALPDGPRQLLRDYIDRGRLGVKSTRGFYDYSRVEDPQRSSEGDGVGT